MAEAGSFTRAAERIGRSQPAVTLQIKRLEELLGQPLIARSSRHVALTAAGEILLPAARAALAALDAAAGRLAGGEIGGEVRFGSPEDFATAYLPDILARFVTAHPGVVLRTHCELTRPLIEGIGRGVYDLVVIKQAPGQAVAGAREIRREELVWAEAAGRSRPRAAPIDLVLSPEPCVYRERALAALDAAGLPWRIVYTSPSLAGAAAAVRAEAWHHRAAAADPARGVGAGAGSGAAAAGRHHYLPAAAPRRSASGGGTRRRDRRRPRLTPPAGHRPRVPTARVAARRLPDAAIQAEGRAPHAASRAAFACRLRARAGMRMPQRPTKHRGGQGRPASRRLPRHSQRFAVLIATRMFFHFRPHGGAGTAAA